MSTAGKFVTNSVQLVQPVGDTEILSNVNGDFHVTARGDLVCYSLDVLHPDVGDYIRPTQVRILDNVLPVAESLPGFLSMRAASDCYHDTDPLLNIACTVASVTSPRVIVLTPDSGYSFSGTSDYYVGARVGFGGSPTVFYTVTAYEQDGSDGIFTFDPDGDAPTPTPTGGEAAAVLTGTVVGYVFDESADVLTAAYLASTSVSEVAVPVQQLASVAVNELDANLVDTDYVETDAIEYTNTTDTQAALTSAFYCPVPVPGAPTGGTETAIFNIVTSVETNGGALSLMIFFQGSDPNISGQPSHSYAGQTMVTIKLGDTAETTVVNNCATFGLVSTGDVGSDGKVTDVRAMAGPTGAVSVVDGNLVIPFGLQVYQDVTASSFTHMIHYTMLFNSSSDDATVSLQPIPL